MPIIDRGKADCPWPSGTLPYPVVFTFPRGNSVAVFITFEGKAGGREGCGRVGEERVINIFSRFPRTKE